MTCYSSKCKVLHIGNANLNSDYKVRDIQLETLDTQKDLGIVTNSDLKTTKHCIEVEKTCNRLLGYIKHQLQYRNKKIVVTLYNSLVLPHLQYCIPFWSPSLMKDINRLEKIQARATKLIPEIMHLSYQNRLQALGMSTLKARRNRLDLIQMYKIIHEVDNVDNAKYFTLNTNKTRNNGYKLEVKTHTTNTLGNSFNYRVVQIWNSLPSEVVASGTLITFKSRLDGVCKH